MTYFVIELLCEKLYLYRKREVSTQFSILFGIFSILFAILFAILIAFLSGITSLMFFLNTGPAMGQKTRHWPITYCYSNCAALFEKLQ